MASIKYQAHVREYGWLKDVEDGRIAGTINECRAMEAFRITELNVDPGDEVNVAAHAHVQDLGWSLPEPVGHDVGSTGLGKHIEAVKIGLTGKDADKYEIWYRLHVSDIGFMEWVHDGAVSGTTGGNRQAEAIQIMLAKKGENFYPFSDVQETYIDLTPPPPQPSTGSSTGSSGTGSNSSSTSKREQALNLARSYVGYTTGTSNDSVFGRRYAGKNAGAWCCYAVRSICDDCGIAFPATGYVPTAMEWAQQKGKWTKKADTSRLQAVLFDWEPNGVPNHIGLLENVSGGKYICLEGNTSGPNGQPIGYWRKTRYGSDILGFINLT